jgi:hypothetical protein
MALTPSTLSTIQKGNANHGASKKLQTVTLGDFLSGKSTATSGPLKGFTSTNNEVKSPTLGSENHESVNQNLDSGGTNTTSGDRKDVGPMQLDQCQDTVRTDDDRIVDVDGKGTFTLSLGSLSGRMRISYFMNGWSEPLISVSQLIGATLDSVILILDGSYLHETDKDRTHHIARKINHSCKILKHHYIVSEPASTFLIETKAKRPH